MSKTLKYVKDFDFSSAGKTVGLCKGGMAKGYSKGGITEKATGERYPSRSAMAKHEMMETPRMQREEVIQRQTVKAPAAPREMIRDTSALGIKNNKNPGIPRKGVPVAPREPMIKPYKAGGLMSDKGAKKVERVMSEYKHGELHSGSKSGPKVSNPKQAVAIALSEARAVGKKKK